VDEEGRIVLVNAQAERLFGYDRQELIGQPIEMLMPPRFRQAHLAHRSGYMALPHARPMGVGLELLGLKRDGTEFPVAISLSPAKVQDTTFVFCDVRDTSEQKQAEQKIRELAAQLEHDNAALAALNKELEAFSYSVSHDLRAPLRAIDGFSQALHEDYGSQLDDEARQYIGRIRAAAQRMAALIDDLLSLARVARAEMNVGETDLTRIAEEFLEELQESSPQRKVEVTVAPGMKVQGDARLLRIAILNLLRNAWKFTGKREHTRIEFSRLEQDGADTYYVRDNGAGFDMAYADKLFGAFQRLHDNSEFAGTGIGLATVQRVIHKHGGRIWAEAEPDKGATFYFTLAERGISDGAKNDPAGRGQS
jgi:PAS domain S-box-containing protein